MRCSPLTVASALLLVLAFPPWNFSFLAWFALIPWFILLRRNTRLSTAAWQGLWLSLLMTLGGFYWVAFAIHRYGGLPLAVGFLGLFVFGLFNQIQFIIFAPIHTYSSKYFTRLPPWTKPLIAASIYTLIDAFLPKLFVDTLGHSQWNVPWTRSWASVGSASLLTFFMVAASCLLSILSARRAAVALVLGCGIVLGGRHLTLARDTDVQRRARWIPMAMIQANVGDFEKVAARLGFNQGAQQIIQTHFRLADEALALQPKPKVLIWPETAYPSAFRVPGNSAELARDQQVETFVRQRGVPHWFGAYDHQGGQDFNTVFMLSPWTPSAGESDLMTYHKSVLLPFGETIPGFPDGGIFKTWFPNMGFFGRGPGAQAFPVQINPPGTSPEIIKVAPLICYEALIDSYSKDAFDRGAELLLNVTNDSWFGNTAEPFLHMSLTVFRSIETGLTQLRATNTGLTVAISPSGELLAQGPLFKEAVVALNVPVYRPEIPTPYVRGGKTVFLSLLAATLAIAVGVRRRRHT